jgi:DNA-directed RNA polymerase subunit RPC12/RpoP
MSEAPSTTIPKDPPAGRKFPCPKCAARLDFDPSSQHLACPYCGYKQEIEPSKQSVQEQDWDTYWNTQAGQSVQLEGRSSQVTCGGCGAVVLLQDNIETDKCPYCATHLENKPESAQGMIQPNGLLSFAVSHRDAINAFNGWIAGRWFAPTGLKQFSNLGKLAGAYVPFWTYDSMTYTRYSGERGDDYTVTESYTATETDDQGQSRQVTKTRQVTRTRWSSVSGNVRHFFDDVLIQASQSLPKDLVGYLAPWDLDKLEGCQAGFLSGFQTERYTIGLRAGFDQAREVMDGEIRGMCRRDIGGDHQRLHSVQTQHVGVTFKHILLPIWVAAYRYHDTPYRILINGRTGQVTGTRPYSWWKIGLLVAVILAAILAVVLALGASGALKGERRDAKTMFAHSAPTTLVPTLRVGTHCRDAPRRGGETTLVPTLRVGTHCCDAPRRGGELPRFRSMPGAPQSGEAVRSHAERGNEMQSLAGPEMPPKRTGNREGTYTHQPA